MAETLFPSCASKLGTQNDNYVKVSESLQHNKKFLQKSRTSFTFWDTVCNLHKQAHAHTHTNCFVYPINLFDFHHLPRVISLALHSYEDVFDIS